LAHPTTTTLECFSSTLDELVCCAYQHMAGCHVRSHHGCPTKSLWSETFGNVFSLDSANILAYRRPPDPMRSFIGEEKETNECTSQEIDKGVVASLPEFGKLNCLVAVQICIPYNVTQAHGFEPIG
jgi:hypothetical protein